MLALWDFIDELEQRFCIAGNKEERDAIALLLGFQYNRLMNNPPNNVVMKRIPSKIAVHEFGNSMLSDYDRVSEVIESCKTEEHIACAQRLVENFCKMYGTKDFNSQQARSCFNARIKKVRIQNGIGQ